MSKKIIKKFFSISLVAILALSAIGCSSSNSTTPSDTTSDQEVKSNEDIMITVAASAGWIRDIDRDLAAKFTEETGIEVDLQANPDDKYENVLMTRLASGEGTDIYMGETGLGLQRYQTDKYALDLSGEDWVEKYPDWMMDQASYNGKLVGFTTWGRDFRAMIYNSDIFDQYNIEVPTDYATFAKASETLLENDITPVYFPGTEEWYCAQAFDGATNIESKAPGTYEKLNNNEIKFAEQPEAIAFLTNLKDSADQGYFGEDYLANTFDQGVTAMASGEFAMWFGWATYANDIENAGGPSADTFLAFPSPYSDDFGTLAMAGAGMTRMINKDSKNIEACKMYFDFLAREENLQAYYDGRPDLLESTLEGATASPPKSFETAMDMVDGKTLPSPMQGVMYIGADGSFGKNIQSMFFGQMTPEQVLESLDAARNNMFDIVEQ